MVNLVFAVYSKTGTRLLGPVDTGTLWAGFPIDECTEPSGDPIVIYDQFADRWILTQFTTRGIDFPDEPLNPFYNCVADLDDAGPDRLVLPLRVHDRVQLPRLPEVRRVEGLVPHHHPRVRHPRPERSTASASTGSSATR